MPAVLTGSGRSVWIRLPCGHRRALLPATQERAARHCRKCRAWYLIEREDGGAFRVTEVTCATCGGRLDGEGGEWWCLSCGDEFEDAEYQALH